MTMTMSAVSRATSTYNPPLTQNTAPVREFRCLYTRDIHKKAKKWHDGSLRFHTFNRRVMVYDDVKNYIGDLHYRHEEELDEGTELQLDRGVKVEVGERLGETQTDLAPLLERRNADENGRQLSSPLRRVTKENRPRCTMPRNQNNLKSLAEVLGDSQAHFGQGNPTSQSPYEQRQVLLLEDQNEPTSKRRKFNSSEKAVTRDGPETTRERLNLPRLEQRPNTRNQISAAPKYLTTQRSDYVTVVSPVQEDSSNRSEVQPLKQKHNSKEQPRLLKDKRNIQHPPRIQQKRTSPTITQVQTISRVKPNARQQVCGKNLVRNKEKYGKRDMTRLLPNPSSFRPKLVYTALLPSTRATNRHLNRSRHSNTQIYDESDREGAFSIPRLDRQPSVHSTPNASDFDEAAIEARYTPSISKSPVRTTRLSSAYSNLSVNSSPMFIPSQRQRSNASLNRETFSLHEDSILPVPIDDGNSSNSAQADKPQLHAETSGTGLLQEPPNFATETPLANDDRTSKRLVFDSSPKLTSHTTPARASHFRRVLSENDAISENDHIEAETVARSINVAQSRPVLEETQPNNVLVANSRSGPKVALERAVSDSSASVGGLRGLTANKSNANILINKALKSVSIETSFEEEPTGPWTATESFLLFGDWWPPGREKPPERAALAELSPTGQDKESHHQKVSVGTAVSMGQITTAREMLRVM